MIKKKIVTVQVEVEKFLGAPELERAWRYLRWTQTILNTARENDEVEYYIRSAEEKVKAALSWVWDAQEREEGVMSTDKYTDSELGVSVDDLMKAVCSVLEPGEIACVRQFARENAIKRNRNWMMTASHERRDLVRELARLGADVEHKWEVRYG